MYILPHILISTFVWAAPAAQMELLSETVRRRRLCINMSTQVKLRCWHIRDKWVTAAQGADGDADKDVRGGEKLEVELWGGLVLERCSASFAWLRLKFCCRNCCCQCCWVTRERRQRWWCHGDCLACRAAAASFLSRSTFLHIVVKEMSSEQKPIWQLRVKWGEKSKSHSIWERLCGAYLQTEITNSLPAAPLTPPSPTLSLWFHAGWAPVPALWNERLLLSMKEPT